MEHDLKKSDRVYIPPRDQSKEAKAKPCTSENHIDQLVNAAELGMLRYEKAMEKLAKV